MFDINTGTDVLEAGGPGPLPTGAGTGNETVSASPVRFEASLVAHATGDAETATRVGHEAGDDHQPAVSAGPATSSTEDDVELPPELLDLAGFGSDGSDLVEVDEVVGGSQTAKSPVGEVPSASADEAGVTVHTDEGSVVIESDGGGPAGAKTGQGGEVSPAGQSKLALGATHPQVGLDGDPVDSTGASSMKDTTTNTPVPTRESGPVESGDGGHTDHARHAQRPANVPPGQANDQSSPATVAEGGGGTRVVPPATPGIHAALDGSGHLASSSTPVPAAGLETDAQVAPARGLVGGDALSSLASVSGRPADFDPMAEVAKMTALREQVDSLTARVPTSVSAPSAGADSPTGEGAKDPSQAALQLAQAVKGAMLAEGDGVVAKLLRTGTPATNAQTHTIQHDGAGPVTGDAVVVDGEQLQATLPQFGLAAMSDGEASLSPMRLNDQTPVPTDAVRAEMRGYEEISRLIEHVRQASGEVAPTGLAGRVSELAHDFAAAATRVPGTSQYANLEQYELPDQLVRAIRMQWRDGLGEARIRLNPPQLGEVQVALQVRQGAVSAVLSSDSDVVRGWMRSQQHELKAMLASQGLELDQLVVEEDRQSRQQPGEGFEQAQRRAPRRLPSDVRFEVRV